MTVEDFEVVPVELYAATRFATRAFVVTAALIICVALAVKAAAVELA